MLNWRSRRTWTMWAKRSLKSMEKFKDFSKESFRNLRLMCRRVMESTESRYRARHTQRLAARGSWRRQTERISLIRYWTWERSLGRWTQLRKWIQRSKIWNRRQMTSRKPNNSCKTRSRLCAWRLQEMVLQLTRTHRCQSKGAPAPLVVASLCWNENPTGCASCKSISRPQWEISIANCQWLVSIWLKRRV